MEQQCLHQFPLWVRCMLLQMLLRGFRLLGILSSAAVVCFLIISSATFVIYKCTPPLHVWHAFWPNFFLNMYKFLRRKEHSCIPRKFMQELLRTCSNICTKFYAINLLKFRGQVSWACVRDVYVAANLRFYHPSFLLLTKFIELLSPNFELRILTFVRFSRSYCTQYIGMIMSSVSLSCLSLTLCIVAKR